MNKGTCLISVTVSLESMLNTEMFEFVKILLMEQNVFEGIIST